MSEPLAILLAGLLFYVLVSLGWLARGWRDKACYLAEQKRMAHMFREMKTVVPEGIPLTNIVSVPVGRRYDA